MVKRFKVWMIVSNTYSVASEIFWNALFSGTNTVNVPFVLRKSFILTSVA